MSKPCSHGCARVRGEPRAEARVEPAPDLRKRPRVASARV